MKNIKVNSEKGSLALFVSIAMLFFMMFMLTLYLSTTTQEKTQLAITASIKETYEKDLENIDEIYDNFVGKDEYIPIYTKEQLKKVGSGESIYVEEVGKYYTFNLNSKYILKNNIDLNKGKYIEENGVQRPNPSTAEQWIPIGTTTTPFTGIFDGNNYTISGVYIDANTSNNQGLFGFLGTNGTLKNIVVSGSITGQDYVGAIVGYNRNGNVIECTNNAKVIGSKVVGGVVGLSQGIITNCVNEVNGTVTVTSGYGAGGIAGRNEKTIENCINNAQITGTTQVGGIAGNCDSQPNVLVSKCYNTAKIYGTGNNVGGIVGGAWQTNNTTTKVTIELCYNTGEIETIAEIAGGITGTNKGIIRNSYNMGNVKGTKNVGGISGVIGNTNTTSNPIGKIINCYSTGTITGTTANTYGGIVGKINNNTCEVTNSYYLTGVTSVGYNGSCSPCNITAKSLTFMQSSDFVDLLGNTNWKLVRNKNNGYPVLNWENGSSYTNYIETENEGNVISNTI